MFLSVVTERCEAKQVTCFTVKGAEAFRYLCLFSLCFHPSGCKFFSASWAYFSLWKYT